MILWPILSPALLSPAVFLLLRHSLWSFSMSPERARSLLHLLLFFTQHIALCFCLHFCDAITLSMRTTRGLQYANEWMCVCAHVIYVVWNHRAHRQLETIVNWVVSVCVCVWNVWCHCQVATIASVTASHTHSERETSQPKCCAIYNFHWCRHLLLYDSDWNGIKWRLHLLHLPATKPRNATCISRRKRARGRSHNLINKSRFALLFSTFRQRATSSILFIWREIYAQMYSNWRWPKTNDDGKQ